MSCRRFLQILQTPLRTTHFGPTRLEVNNFPTFSRFKHCYKPPKKKAIVFLATGFEEIEFTTIVDILRRGEVDVMAVGTSSSEPVVGANKIRIYPDVEICTLDGTYDALVLPGGMEGSQKLASNERVGEMLKAQEEACRVIAAICAAPTALKAHGIGKGKKITSYPSVKGEMTEDKEYTYCTDDVVVDDYLITSRGPATSMKFALTILRKLTSDEKAVEIAKGLLCM